MDRFAPLLPELILSIGATVLMKAINGHWMTGGARRKLGATAMMRGGLPWLCSSITCI